MAFDDSLAVTSNKLELKNPHRVFGVVLVASGAVLGALVLIRAPVVLSGLRNFWYQFSSGPEDYIERLGAANGFRLAVFLLASYLTLVAAVHALIAVLRGLRMISVFFVPVGVPASIAGAPDVLVNDLFRNRAISSFAKPSGALQTAISIFSPRFRYAGPLTRAFTEETVRSLPAWLVGLGLLSAPHFLSAEMFDKASQHLGHVVGSNWPLPVYLAAIGAFVLLGRILAVMASVPATPTVEVQEWTEHLDSTGNPANFYNQIQKALAQLRHENFPNRVILETPPSIGRTSKGETSAFSAQVLVESQPLPVAQAWNFNAVILDVLGATLRSVGYIMVAYTTVSNTGPTGVIGTLLYLLTAVVAIRRGTYFLRRGLDFHYQFRFESDVFWVSLNGTYTVSNIGIGDGRGGHLYSERAVVQSDTYIRGYGSHIVSECSPLEAPRFVVNAVLTKTFQDRMRHLTEAMRTFEDTGGRLANIDLSAQSVQKVVAANAQISALENAARQLPSRPEDLKQIPGVLGGALPAPDSAAAEWKTCPDCGETVRLAARICRFCKHSFAGPPPGNAK